MSAEDRNERAALATDLDLTEDDTTRVKGGMFPIEPGPDRRTLPRIFVRKKKKAAKRYYPGGGRPV